MYSVNHAWGASSGHRLGENHHASGGGPSTKRQEKATRPGVLWVGGQPVPAGSKVLCVIALVVSRKSSNLNPPVLGGTRYPGPSMCTASHSHRKAASGSQVVGPSRLLCLLFQQLTPHLWAFALAVLFAGSALCRLSMAGSASVMFLSHTSTHATWFSVPCQTKSKRRNHLCHCPQQSFCKLVGPGRGQ